MIGYSANWNHRGICDFKYTVDGFDGDMDETFYGKDGFMTAIGTEKAVIATTVK